MKYCDKSFTLSSVDRSEQDEENEHLTTGAYLPYVT